MLSGRNVLGLLGWARQLRPCSFRGARFLVESYGGTYGRRGVDHEYPGRDTPFAEDLGRSQRVWRFTGFVIGDNYPSERDQLVKACEQQGPGELIHPTIGTVQAVCRSCAFTEERERGRYCAFEFEFREAGQLQEPTDATDPDTAVGNAAEPVGTTSETNFLSNFSIAGGGAFLSNAASFNIQGLASTLQQLRLPSPTAPQSQFGQLLEYGRHNSTALAARPPDLAAWMSQSFAAFTEAGEAAPVVSAMLRFIRPPAVPPRGSGDLTPWREPRAAHTGVNLPITIRRAANQKAFDEFTYRLALREIGYAVTGLELDNYDQAIATLAEITAAFAQVEAAAADAGDDEVYIALIGLRAAITRMIGARAVNLNPMVTYRVVSPTPANSLTLAWRLYADSGRDLEICRRVAARNPAFLPLQGRVLAA